MGIFNNFPFTNFQEKNLDCIYKLAKEAKDTAATAEDTVDTFNDRVTTLESVFHLDADPIQFTGEAYEIRANALPDPVVNGLNEVGAEGNYADLVGVCVSCDANSQLQSMVRHLNESPSSMLLQGYYVVRKLISNSTGSYNLDYSGIFRMVPLSKSTSSLNKVKNYIVTRTVHKEYAASSGTFTTDNDTGFTLYDLSTLIDSY